MSERVRLLTIVSFIVSVIVSVIVSIIVSVRLFTNSEFIGEMRHS